jgi:hypothetical protein
MKHINTALGIVAVALIVIWYVGQLRGAFYAAEHSTCPQGKTTHISLMPPDAYCY